METRASEATAMKLMGETSRTCPHCGSSDVRRSRRRGFVEHLARFVGKSPYRCDDCDARFYRKSRHHHN